MNIIFFSIFFLRLKILVAIYVVFMRHLDSYCERVGSLNVRTVAGRGRELGGYYGNEKGWCVVRLDRRGTKRNSWGRLQVAQQWCKRARVEWCGDSRPLLSKELKEELISVSRKTDPVIRRDGG